jgi:hypothetical protein
MNSLDRLYLTAKFKMERFLQDVLLDENGDTNLISIIIVLGIVLALVLVFKGYIKQILAKVAGGVSSFTTSVTD